MSAPASPDQAVYVTEGSTIFDYSGNGWFIQNGQVAEQITDSSGAQTTVIDADTADVVAIAFANGFVWQMNSQGLWWAKTGGPGSYDGWLSGGTDGLPITPLRPSASGTAITANPSVVAPVVTINPSPLVDASGNLWWISGSGQVVENGVVDSETANVIEMACVNGVIWQENTSNLWWAKTGGQGSYDGWSSGPGTNTSSGTYTPPVPIALTWIGGGDNEASNPADWIAPTLPASGDELLFPASGGTMNVTGNVLAGTVVELFDNGGPIPSPPVITFNLSGHAALTISSLVPSAAPVTINLAPHSKWTGGFNESAYGGSATVLATGDGSGKFDNTSSTVSVGMIVDANVVGTGSFTVVGDHSMANGDGQSVEVDGGNYSGNYGTLQIDHPGVFHAAITLGRGDVVLEGLKATSYSLTNGILALYNADSVVDSIRLSLETTPEYGATDFGVSQTASGISVHGNGVSYSDGGTSLPLHS